MNKLNINIAGSECELVFDYECFKVLSEKWNLPGYQGVLDKLATFGEIKDDILFNQMEIIGDVIEAALVSNPEKQPNFARRDIMNTVISDVTQVVLIVEKLFKVIVKPKPEPAIEPGKKRPLRT